MTVSVMCLFLSVPLVGLQCVIGVVRAHAHLLFIVKLERTLVVTASKYKIQEALFFTSVI